MMKKLPTRLSCLLLSLVMLLSLLPLSAFAADVQEGGGIATQAAGGPTIPGYNQVTSLKQIKADRDYLIVAQAPNGTFYALYLNADGANNSPGTTAYPNCTATLTVSNNTVSAVSTANTSTSIAMSDLHVTIAESSGGYTIKNSTHALRLNGTMYIAAGSAPALPLSFVDGGRFSVKGTGRYLTFNVSGATSTETHFPTHPTGFCGWNDPQPQYIPIYLFIQGDLPVEPGMNLAKMLSGDKIGGGDTTNADPDGQNSWVFTGGRAAQGSFTDIKGARSYAGHFEEYIRYTHAKQLQPSGEANTPYFQRHVINAAYTGQTLQNIVESFETRIGKLKPRAVSYLVDENGSSEANFAANLGSLITKALALQGGTGMIVIETLTAADKSAVDAVVDGLTDAQKANVLSVQFTLTAEEKTDGYPNASGHLAMAKQLADAVTDSTVSTAANWPYGAISGSTLDTNFPNKASLSDHTHGYTNPTATGARKTIKDKVDDENTPMTWLFMGDSITHGAAWTGGYDTLAQLFEKFVKDDLHRSQDIVINAGSSGATTASTINDLNRRLEKYSPDVVVLMLGTNDAGGSVSETTYKTNLRTILDKIMAKGATPVLRTPPPTSRSGYDIATYAQYIRDVVGETKYAGKVVLVDQYDLWTSNDWRGVFSRDTLHPDEAGHLWFAHQLIKELALWDENYKICKLEYVQMKEAEAITIPGYTQLTDISNLDEGKGYLIVSQDSNGGLYALYPSKEGETLTSGFLTSPGGTNDGARAAKLTVSGQTVTAAWLKDNSALDMENLLFTIKKSGSRYVFTAFNGRHLNMGPHMFTEGEQTLTIASRGTAAPNAFEIKNPDLSKPRYLDFTKNGDPKAFHKGSETVDTWGTDFWAPESMSMNIYLFASNVKAPTAKESVQKLMDEIAAKNLNENTYTRASWAALQNALTTADGLVKDTGVDDNAQSVKEAWDALRAAYEGLNEKPVPPTVPEGDHIIENWKTMVPKGGTTTDEPFAYGTGGSDRFRIPAIITLQHQSDDTKNGRLLSAIDARWNHTGDACGLDTIVSYSDDTGANWHYNFANYFGDSTNAYAQYGTAFIDPVLLEAKDGTIYLMVDIWPGGVALNTAPNRPANSTGCEEIDGVNRLVLYTDAPNASATAYDYYVKDFVDAGDGHKYAPVYAPMGEGTADIFVGYYIDEYYYLYYNAANTFEGVTNKGADNDKIYCQRLGATNTWVQQNVFFYNATLHVRDASYLWIVTSKDGGETWGTPQMINASRTDTERFYGVGPGAGLCVKTADENGATPAGAIPDGTLLLPVYIWPSELAGFIYSTDGGESWKPSPNYATTSSDATSESCLVQIDEKTVRHFYRESWKRSSTAVAYTDHTWDSENETWTTGSIVRINGVNHYGACQVSAIKYSKQVDGKDVILYSTPTNSGGRSKGVIYAFLVNDDAGHTMELYNTYAVNGDLAYAYSSLTETADGDIALLYESTGDAVIFKIIPITDIIPDLDVTGWTGPYDGKTHTVTVTANPNTEALQYATSTDSGTNWSDWSNTKPIFTNAGTYTVKVKATWGNIVKEASATVTINKATPTISITSLEGTALADGQEITLTVRGVPDKATADHISLACSNTSTENGHNPDITLTKQSDGTYTGTHTVEEGRHTFTATYTESDNYVGTTASYSVTVSNIEVTVKPYSGDYDGNPHSITVTKGAGVEVAYRTTDTGEYDLTEPPTYTDAGTYTIYYQATKEGASMEGSANVTIAKAMPEITITCSHNVKHDEENHQITTTELANNPLVLTITGVPAQDQGQFTLTSFGDTVRNLEHKGAGTWEATPNIPPITRTFTFTAVFDPTVDQEGNVITNPNYERATAEFTVTVVRPPNEVPNFKFKFVEEKVTVDEETPLTATLTIPYDGADHSPLEALDYDEDLVLTYHIPVTEDAGDDVPADTWIAEVPKYRQPGTYTVSVMASPKNSPIARVLTVVLEIEDRDIRTDLTITPTAPGLSGTNELDGGGTVTLTVTGMPAVGTLTVTCKENPEMRITEGNTRGTYTVVLPNEDATYTFIATYSGAGSYQEAEAQCWVSVTAITHTVTFDSQGGSAVLSQTVTEGETAVEPTTAPTKTGCTFGGWYTTADCTTAYDFTQPVMTDITLYAKWTVNSNPGPIGGIVTPPTTTTVVENPDGSTTTTVTDNRTGTVTETTEMPDGSTETVETKKDGTVTATTEKADGTTEVVETKPDGTVTATNTDPEGGKVEKITTPDEDVTITVTDPEGETLAKVEIPAEIPAPSIEFVDVPEGHWAESAINQAAGLGLVEGVGGNQFNWNGNMERGDLTLVLHRLSSNISTDNDVTFDDVPADAYYAESVAWAVATGVVKGYNETEFGPKDNITREELAVMLYRYATLLKLDTTVASTDGLDVFTDSGSIHDWAENGMAWCVENGIIQGKGNDTLDPGAKATRAEVTIMLQRFMDLMKK